MLAGAAGRALEYVHLGDTPVAVFQEGSTPTAYAVYSDHLNMRRIVNASNQTL